ncbi:MAG TPA: hypothetical protein VHM94_13335 [Acidimicrobiia bacterium]|nr:hypothetical protein [Acidimicrobiia bacterium]
MTWAAVELSDVTLLADREHRSEHLTADEIGLPRFGGVAGWAAPTSMPSCSAPPSTTARAS